MTREKILRELVVNTPACEPGRNAEKPNVMAAEIRSLVVDRLISLGVLKPDEPTPGRLIAELIQEEGTGEVGLTPDELAKRIDQAVEAARVCGHCDGFNKASKDVANAWLAGRIVAAKEMRARCAQVAYRYIALAGNPVTAQYLSDVLSNLEIKDQGEDGEPSKPETRNPKSE